MESRKRDATGACAERESKLNAEFEGNWRELELAWKSRTEPMCSTIAALNASAEKLFPPWEPKRWEHWTPPLEFGDAASFGRLDADLGMLCGGVPKNLRLAVPGGTRAIFPLLLAYPGEGSLLFETNGACRSEILASLNNVVLRLLSSAPAGRLNFTLIDPVGLGESFSGVMHLADHAEHLIHGRIWTQPGQIEQQLSDLNEHMEKVIQMYLRNEYATIAEYNERAGNIAEKYHFVVVADFPANFSDAAARRLLRIAASGARCGVFTLIHWDQRQSLPQDFVADELRQSSVCVTCNNGRLAIAGTTLPGVELRLDAPPPPEFAIEFIQRVGLQSRDSNRIEVPFTQVTPSSAERWTLDTTAEVRVPIGRTGATKLQYLALGKGTRQHALVAGKTGSGKSTLFHVIITNLSLWCSPEQVEFYLIDFKKGVEFKCYATHRLPHARVVAIESDREFGLSVLQRLDEELKRRGELFRKLGVQDLMGYKRAGGKERMPRSLLIIDEFQVFFVEDDKLAQTASLLLDRIVRQGRAFGIHVLLGSQTLGGAYTVARTTLGQMVVRIALQCNEADAYLIMDENNSAPRLLSRPGEGIYNDASGTVEGNSPFQAVWLPDSVRDSSLAEVRTRADAARSFFDDPIVFEGNAPADVMTNQNLRGLLEAPAIRSSGQPSIWLGSPNSIKGPTEVTFRRQSGNNLLFVGQREETLLALFSISLVSLAAQHRAGTVRLIVCDASQFGSPEQEYLEQVIGIIPHRIVLIRQNELANTIAAVGEEIFRRTGDESPDSAPTTFLFINGLQKFNRLRYEDDFGLSSGDSSSPANPASILNRLICEGTRLGCHVIAACDTYSNVNRYLSRQALGEFEMRVLFQMSANDSASLIDNPKAGSLGLHRALFYNAQQGSIETFRPYALPEPEWMQEAGRHLVRLLSR
jgi:hypothetical protein